METVTLKATPRTENGKGPARRLRAQGKMPAVAYGTDIETQPLAIEREALKRILTSARGRNTIIKLEVEGGTGMDVMVQDYTVHPVSRLLLHADLIKITETTPIVVEVPFLTVGKSVGVAAGGTLLSNIRTVRVRCLPNAIPDSVEFDVTALQIDDAVKVKELTLPPGLEVLLPPERTVVVVAPPRVLEETTVAADGEAAEGEAAEGGEAAKADDAKDADKKD